MSAPTFFTLRRTVGGFAILWLAAVTLLHGWMNLHLFAHTGGSKEYRFRIGFLPVTCHLTCPVTDFINRQQTGHSIFDPVRFNGWPELKEAYLSGYTPATFILAPMAIALREQGCRSRSCTGAQGWLGVDGAEGFEHLQDRRSARENDRGAGTLCNQWLLLYRELKSRGMSVSDVNIVEMAPPDMPTALYSKAVDAVTSGEPFMGRRRWMATGAAFTGKGCVPGFISCVLAVSEDMIRNHRPQVQELVNGIAASGKWLDSSMDHRMEAAQFVSTLYYNQNPRLLAYVLSKPPDRVKYSNLKPNEANFEEIEMLGKAAGMLKGTAHFNDYVDLSFAPDDDKVVEQNYEPKTP